MLLIDKHLPGGAGLAPSLLARAPALSLDWDTRSKSRFGAQDDTGRSVAVFLPRGTLLRGGDALVGEDGTVLRVKAAPQPVLRVHGAGPDALVRAAYHLGNRHVQLQLGAEFLQLEPDPVLRDMLLRMGLQVEAVQAGFEPEAGAYADSHGAARHHGHDHPHGHSHEHIHDHGPGTGHP